VVESGLRVKVDLARQALNLWRGRERLRSYPVSTARNGPGERSGSGCTPTGRFRIRLRIGAGCPENTVFVGRRPTGEIYAPDLASRFPGRDWILTRILWLTGTEPGKNRGGAVDTLRRFIYIHGCPDSEPMGVPRSHGCIRMRNRDLIELFDLVAAGTPVTIDAGQGAD
jgi:lipoprotein-anchoring transpeptidase ErfK/SrfK